MYSFVSGLFAQHNCLRFIHVLRGISSLFLFIGELFSIVCLYHYVLIHSPFDGPSVCFQVSDIMKEAAMKVCEQVFYVDVHFHFSWVNT